MMNRKYMQYFFMTMSILLIASPAFAQVAGSAHPENQWIPLAAGLGMAIAAAGCGLGQGKAAGAAAEALARNPGVRPALFTFMLIGLAFIESLALYTFVIIFVVVK
jgi:F-type H+-transporting ATPase subunit c